MHVFLAGNSPFVVPPLILDFKKCHLEALLAVPNPSESSAYSTPSDATALYCCCCFHVVGSANSMSKHLRDRCATFLEDKSSADPLVEGSATESDSVESLLDMSPTSRPANSDSFVAIKKNQTVQSRRLKADNFDVYLAR